MAQTVPRQSNTNLTPWLVTESEFPKDGNTHDQLQFLLRYAVLAQSYYNTQPWEFSIEDSQINLYTKESRWLKTADPDKRELYLSVGCALENLLIAAEHFRFGHQISRFPEANNENWVARVIITTISQSTALRSPALFDAITKRHTHHHRFDTRPLQEPHLQTIRKYLTEEDIWLEITDDRNIMDKVAKYAAHANTISFADSRFVDEVKQRIGEGVFGKAQHPSDSDSGQINTQKTTQKKAQKTTQKTSQQISQKAATQKQTGQTLVKRVNQQEQEILKSAPSIAVLSSPFDNHMTHVIAGQIFEKLCLEAALLGVRCLPLNQLIEVPESRNSVNELFPHLKGKPLVVFAMGYGEEETQQQWTPRLTFDQVLH